MKRILLIALLNYIVLSAVYAVPAKRVKRTVRQKDGTCVTLVLCGDEHFHYLTTTDNIPVVMDNDSSFYYAHVSENTWECGKFLAHDKDKRSREEQKYISEHITDVFSFIKKKWNQRRAYYNVNRNRVLELNTTPLIGVKKSLVILVQFPDLSMSVTNVREEFDHRYNQIGYDKDGHIGSVHDYFYDQSYGLFDITFDVVGPVTVSKEYAYYGRNRIDNDNDANVSEMISEACLLVNNQVNYKDYDWNNDGNVEQVFVVYAGYAESAGAPANTIWPHHTLLEYYETGTLTLDGVIVNSYACSSELAGKSGVEMDGIGTFCHEFSHCLGIPDFYDVDYSGGVGMSYWDVMSSGNNSGPNGNGEVPCGYSAYERYYMGWLDLIDLQDTIRIKDMPNIADSAVAYRIVNDNFPDEYLILENRQNDKWFSYLKKEQASHGLLVTHVDYDEYSWEYNQVNTNRNHQRMTIIPADNSYSVDNLSGDIFPGPHNVTELTDESHMNNGGVWYHENSAGNTFINAPLTNIRERDGLISFDFKGGIYVPTPVLLDESDVTADGFTMQWETLSEVDSFSVEVQEINTWVNPLDRVICKENFNNFRLQSGSNDGIMDVSIYMDSFTQTPGWLGKGLYTSEHGAKVVAVSKGGYLATPLLAPASDEITVQTTLLSNSESSVRICVLNHQSDTIDSVVLQTTTSSSSYVLNLTCSNDNQCRIHVDANNAFYISSLTIYDGFFTSHDLLPSSILAGTLKPVKKYTFSGIIDNQYRISGLESEKYKYRVRAMFDNASSDWTEYKEITLLTADGINKYISDDFQRGIYNIKGQKVSHPRGNGIYIIDDGLKKRKLIIGNR